MARHGLRNRARRVTRIHHVAAACTMHVQIHKARQRDLSPRLPRLALFDALAFYRFNLALLVPSQRATTPSLGRENICLNVRPAH